MSKYKDPLWLEEKYVDEQLSQREIADICGVHRSTIRRWMDKFDIATRKDCTERPPHHGFRNDNYERIKITVDGTQHDVLIHRLLMVAEHGLDAIKGKHVHHKNGYKFDNRPSNLEVLEPSDHHRKHDKIENLK